MPASLRTTALGIFSLMLVMPLSVFAEETAPSQNVTQASHCEQCEQAAHGSVVISDGNCPTCRTGRGCRGPKCHYGPGHGWCPPTGIPAQRAYIEYMKWYPTYWSGMGPGPAMQYHPQVYTPTDTTQLGFYYQQVPQWRPMPGMLPAPPHPNNYHARDCQQCRQSGGHCPQCEQGYHGNVVYESGTVTGTPTPVADPISEPTI